MFWEPVVSEFAPQTLPDLGPRTAQTCVALAATCICTLAEAAQAQIGYSKQCLSASGIKQYTQHARPAD